MDDVRVEAERLKADAHLIPDIRGSNGTRLRAEKVADAWLAANPADDGEPVSGQWLTSVGFDGRGEESFAVKAYGLWLHIWKRLDPVCDGVWFVATNNNEPLREGRVTRGDVRRLALALSIALTEPAP